MYAHLPRYVTPECMTTVCFRICQGLTLTLLDALKKQTSVAKFLSIRWYETYTQIVIIAKKLHLCA